MARSRKPLDKDKSIDENAQFWIMCGIDMKRRRVYLDEEVDEYSMGWINRALMLMVEADAESPIEVHINCFGGSLYDGLGLYDMLRSLPVEVKTFCIGSAMSMALILFLAGDERVCTTNSTFMAHSVSGGVWGKEFEVDIDSTEIKRGNDLLLEILGERTGRSKEWWSKKIKHIDYYFGIKEALKIGVIKNV